jgi:hypothetical protein
MYVLCNSILGCYPPKVTLTTDEKVNAAFLMNPTALAIMYNIFNAATPFCTL